MTRRILLIALCVLILSTTGLAAVQVSETTIALPTWSEGPPDTNPLFDAFANSGVYNGNFAVYPYTLRTNFLSDSPTQTWRLLVLENEYLRCRVFPDLGGHLYSCLDKINGREMFYANPVIRKGWVGLRGAWVAMGIELNYPVGHSLVGVSPVSYGTVQNSDGSGSLWVADIDRKTGLEFRVEFRLQPLSTVLIQNVNLYNRGEVRQPYYFWNNAEVKMEDQVNRTDTFAYPTYLVAAHGFTFLDTWPVSTTGVDYSVEKNFTNGTGLFQHGSKEPFMSIYHPTTRTATVHFADNAAVPGKKLWAWGNGDVGDAWVQANLTSNFNSYMETQGGNVENQETHIFLDPQQSSHFTEYWMPARELDGVTRANPNAVLYFGRSSGGALNVQLNANLAFPNATVRILNGANVVYSATASLAPSSTYSYSLPNATAAQYTVQVLDHTGNVLITHTENQINALTASSVTLGNQPQVNLNLSDTDQEVLYRADYNERLQSYYFAESDYRLGLSKFPQSLPLLKASGRLAVAAGRYSDGQSQLSQYLAGTPNDDEAHYYLGLAYYGLGQFGSASSEWTKIQNTADFGRAATFELACLSAQTGDLATAVSLFEAVNASTRDAVRAAGMEIAVLRRHGQAATASTKLAQWRTIAPTDLLLRYEQTLAGANDDALWTALGAEPERVLNLADDYMRLGFFADAATLLGRAYPDVPPQQREPGSTLPQNSAPAAYHRGYSKMQTGGSGTADFAAASGMALPYVFPNRLSSLPVLRQAVQSNNSDATAHYLLGMLFMSQRLVNDAMAEWQLARSIRKDLPALHRNLGRALLDLESDPVSALPVLSEGLSYEPANNDLQNAYQRALAAAPAGSNCSVTLSGPTTVGAGAGSGTITASSSSCALKATAYSTWLSITSAANGKVTYAVTANPYPAPRSAAVSISGQLVVVTQAALACSFAVPNATVQAPAGGGTITVSVTAPNGCAWSLSSVPSWITSAVHSESGNATITLTVAANTGRPRKGTVVVASQSVEVNQDSSTRFFAAQLYLDLLNRNPDDAGLNFWVAQLDAGIPRAEVAAQFFNSDEFSGAGLYLIKLYEGVLHRDPDFSGWLYWCTQMQAGLPALSVLMSFLQSGEFQTVYGNLSNSAFVTLAYQNVLGRSPDAGGYAFWLGQLNSGSVSRPALMDGFIRSPEFDTDIHSRAYANLLYLGFLRRSAEPTGLQFWTQTLAAGDALTDAINAFINSTEYVGRFVQDVS